MTAIITYLRGRTGRNLDPGVNRIHAGYLELYNVERKQKWVIFEEIISAGPPRRFLLTLYPKNNEKKNKRKCYVINNDNFIGIEEGTVEGTVGREAYFVIFLTSDTLIFQSKDISEADNWCKILKEHLTHERWSIQLKDDDDKLERYYLHVTKSFVSLTHNPPEVYKRWNVPNIGCVNCESGGYLSIVVVESGSDSGYFQIKTQKSTDMTRIKEAVDKAKKEIAHREGAAKVEEKSTNEERMTHSQHQTSSVTQKMTSRHKQPDVVIGCEDELTWEPQKEYGNLEYDKRYQNGDVTVVRPPPVPIRDDLVHFESVTLGDTIEAIRKHKICFRDSLKIKPSKRHQLFAIMDATCWWKHLAAAIGLDVSEIQVVENLAPTVNNSWTETVIYHWECTRKPSRICSIREMQNIARETNRTDLLNMLAEE